MGCEGDAVPSLMQPWQLLRTVLQSRAISTGLAGVRGLPQAVSSVPAAPGGAACSNCTPALQQPCCDTSPTPRHLKSLCVKEINNKVNGTQMQLLQR